MQNDTLFTISTGNYILNNGIDEAEPFTFHENLRFIKLRWAFDVTVAMIYNKFNFFGLYFFVIVISCIISIFLYESLDNLYKNKIVSFFISIFTIKYMSSNLVCRAQIISYLLFALEMYFIEKLLEKNEKKYILFLVLDSIFLVNFHSSVWLVFFLPFFTIFAEKLFYIVKTKLNFKLLDKFIIRNIDIKNILIAFFICLITGLISPLGLSPYTYIFKVMGGISKEIIKELQPLEIFTTAPTEFIILGLIITFLFTKLKYNIRDLILIIGFLIMSRLATRNLFIALIFMAYPLTRIICDLLKEYDLSRITDLIEKKIQKNYLAQLFILAIVVYNSSIYYSFIKPINYLPYYSYPILATDYIIENVDLNNARIYTDFNWGSYVEFRGIKAFIDSRSEVFCKEFSNTDILEDWYKANQEDSDYINILLEKYGITHIIISIDSELIEKLNNCVEIYSDDSFKIYEIIKE